MEDYKISLNESRAGGMPAIPGTMLVTTQHLGMSCQFHGHVNPWCLVRTRSETIT
jgi:hypothetical protein